MLLSSPLREASDVDARAHVFRRPPPPVEITPPSHCCTLPPLAIHPSPPTPSISHHHGAVPRVCRTQRPLHRDSSSCFILLCALPSLGSSGLVGPETHLCRFKSPTHARPGAAVWCESTLHLVNVASQNFLREPLSSLIRSKRSSCLSEPLSFAYLCDFAERQKPTPAHEARLSRAIRITRFVSNILPSLTIGRGEGVARTCRLF